MSISSAPREVLRVGQLVIRLAERIQSDDEFKDLWVEGEVVQSQAGIRQESALVQLHGKPPG